MSDSSVMHAMNGPMKRDKNSTIGWLGLLALTVAGTSQAGTVLPGATNSTAGGASAAVVSGDSNNVGAYRGVILGGATNQIPSGASFSTIAGGFTNTLNCKHLNSTFSNIFNSATLTTGNNFANDLYA